MFNTAPQRACYFARLAHRQRSRRGFALVGALLLLGAVALLLAGLLAWQSRGKSHVALGWRQELARRQALVGLGQARRELGTALGPDARFTHWTRPAEGPEVLEAWDAARALAPLASDNATGETAPLAHGREAPLVELRDPEGRIVGRYGWTVDDEGMHARPPALSATAPWSRGVLAAPDGTGLLANWSAPNVAPVEAAAFLAKAHRYWDERQTLQAGPAPAAPCPLLTEASIEGGVYVFGAPNVYNRYRLNLRFYVQAELWNPYPWPLVFPDHRVMGYEQAARLVWKGLPSVRVTSYRPSGSGWSVRDQTEWLALDELLREEAPRERNITSWLDVEGLRLEPGEVYRAMEPSLDYQPEGLARRVSNEFYVDVQRDRLVVEFSDAVYSLHLLPFDGEFAEYGYEVSEGYQHLQDLPVAGRSWTFDPPLAVERNGNPAVYVPASDRFRPANRYWGTHWHWDEEEAVTGTKALADNGDAVPVNPADPLVESAWTGGYWQSPAWRAHDTDATQAIWLDWPREPGSSLADLRNAPAWDDLGRPGAHDAWLDAAFFAEDQRGLVPWPEDAVLPEPDDPAAAAQVLRQGVFNLNSTDYAAWRAWLDRAFERLPRSQQPLYTPVAWEALDEVNLSQAASVARGRALTAAQLDQLAARLAEGNRQRAQPWRSLAELAESGWLQDTLEAVGPAFSSRDGAFPAVEPLYTEAERLNDRPALALAGVIDQADMLLALAPFAAVRSDTFRVRFYGEAVHPRSGEVTGRAWGEAILQRTPELRADGQGRAFAVRALRWLTPPD